MSTLPVVEEILREVGEPMSVRQIVDYSQGRLPTKSKTPDTVVARDLSMDIKKKGESSLFARVAPGRYTMRSFVEEGRFKDWGKEVRPEAVQPQPEAQPQPQQPEAHAQEEATDILSSAMPHERAGTLPAGNSGAHPEHAEHHTSSGA